MVAIMEQSKKTTPLRRAVDYLISKGKLDKDKDLADKFNLSQGTISSYLSGKPGKEFVRNFEKEFNISLKYFEYGTEDQNAKFELHEPEQMYHGSRISDHAILKLANANELLAQANKTLADNSKDLIMLVKTTVNEKKQIPEAFDTMMGNLLESLAELLSDKEPKNKKEVAALLSRAYHVYPPGT